MREDVSRKGDMHSEKSLRVLVQNDGDIIVCICSGGLPIESDGPGSREDNTAEVEFCAIGAGGGRSPHTREALRKLIEAIRRDNQEKPI